MANEDFDKVDIMHNQSKIETLAKSYDQIKNYKKAYEYFKELNKIALNTNVNNANKKLFLDLVEKRINFFNKDNTKNWNEINEEDKNADPVFLIGFPRSGTTLLDTILRSHPSVEVLEEIPLINYFIENLESKFGSDLNELGKIDINLIKQMLLSHQKIMVYLMDHIYILRIQIVIHHAMGIMSL